VNNLHPITLYKLHNKVACRASRARRVECVEPCSSTSKMHGLDTSIVSSRVVSRFDDPSGIWAITATKVHEECRYNAHSVKLHLNEHTQRTCLRHVSRVFWWHDHPPIFCKISTVLLTNKRTKSGQLSLPSLRGR